MPISGYYINNYWYIFCYWILVVIDGYFVIGYRCLLMVIILMPISGYYINDYWYIFCCWILVVIIGYYWLLY